MSGIPSCIDQFRADFLYVFPERADHPLILEGFGDHPALMDELAELVILGKKRATAGLEQSFFVEGAPLPAPGLLTILLNGSGTPKAVIETVSVERIPFLEVPAEFAAAEGEGDGSLANWRDSHRRFFVRESQRLGFVFREDMIVVCERFRVIWPLAIAD